MQGGEVRRAFIEFFQQRGHLLVPSSSLVPHNDPSVLLTTAGMQQMIPYFLGAERAPAPRLVSSQKCFRTGDIESVGDASHLTFFEMLGNFSVGDYFKAGAIDFAWDFLTKVVKIDPARLYPTTHPSDEVAWRHWREVIGVPERQLVKLEDNWWDRGRGTGPCGPDSEIYVDLGPELSCGRPECAPGCDCGRYLETWNLVFMEFYETPELVRTPLPSQNIDTGMGLERLTMVLQGTPSVYETDLYMPIMQRAAQLTSTVYGRDERTDFALRVLGDHSRGVTFLIGDGVLPSNEGRGYILRRILRRAVRYGRQLGLERPFLSELGAVVIDMFGHQYAELARRAEHILHVIRLEEAQFSRTLSTGLTRFEQLAAGLQAQGQTLLSGDEAFRLYDTYGFPIHLTRELAAERGLSIGEADYEAAMAAQRQAGRAAAKFKEAGGPALEFYGAQQLPSTGFLGYAALEAEATILSLLGPSGPLTVAEAGQLVEVVLDRTPFYGEAGGQVGDTGLLTGQRGQLVVEDTQRPVPGLIAHRGQVSEGFLQVGDRVTASVDSERRAEIMANHTATHLIHRALHLVLGAHATQAGSLVAPDRLRFDFSHFEALSPDELRAVEQIANAAVRRDDPVADRLMPLPEALASGAMALFGEKYGDEVRVVRIGDFSRELCGGTHVRSTGQIGQIVVLGEGGIGSGVRRLEALSGIGAERYTTGVRATLGQLAGLLRAPATELVGAVQGLQERLRESERVVQQLQGRLAGSQAGQLLDQVQALNGAQVLAARTEAASVEALKQLGDQLRDRLGPAVVVLGAVVGERPALLAMASREVVAKGVNAGTLVREVARLMGGGGGGRPEMGQAGGGDAAKLDSALAAVRDLVAGQLKQ